ncbi:OmpH family outer membrane protein [Chryseobacterium sp.]|uniref:OmpH family outer membrane protein n=1 Tax=Chryseobacterium sp. TaxID=1871047 RepID=UPI00289FEF18|nr:OmpH family outer membrane protein [Chryseobacterium sp.]
MKKLSVLFAAILMMVSFGTAKAQKVATLDVFGVLNAMPEKKKADADLKVFTDAKEAEIKKKMEAAQTKYDLYMKEAQTKTEAENKLRGDEMKKLQDEISAMQQKAQKDLQAKQDAAFNPIETKLNAAIEKVSKAGAYEFILDGNSTSLVYKNGADITADVKKELGIK